MDTFSRLTPEQRSELVAYLDGELDERATAEIETVLARSAVARNDVEMLARTYDLLDELPRLTASQELTARTLASVRLEGVRPDITQTAWFQRARRGVVLLGASLLMVAASLAGYTLTQRMAPNEADVLVENYGVIDRLDVYREVGSYEFLQALANEPAVRSGIQTGGSHDD